MMGATDQRTTSGPADPILRVKGRRHDRTHDQRNAEKALDQRATSRHDGFATDSGASRGDLLGPLSDEAVRRGDVQEPMRERPGSAVEFAGGLDFHTERDSGRPHRLDERLHSEDGDHPLQIVGENVKAHLRADLFEGAQPEVGRAHPCLDGSKRMLRGWRRMRMVLGARSSRSCIASRTASCSQRLTRRSFAGMHFGLSAQAAHFVVQ